MPVSRKRKKKSQPVRRSPRQPIALTPATASVASAFDGLLEYRRELATHRSALARHTAGAMVDALTAVAPERSDDALEDDLCVRYGAAMVQFEGGAVED